MSTTFITDIIFIVIGLVIGLVLIWVGYRLGRQDGMSG